MRIGLMMLGLVVLRLILQFQSGKDIPPVIDQVMVQLIQAEGETLLLSFINSLILFGIRKNFLSSGRTLLLYLFTSKGIKLIAVIIKAYHCYHL
jgi:cytochrome b561